MRLSPFKQFLLRDATASFKAEAAELHKQIQRLQSQLDVLSGQASTLIQGRRTRSAAALSANEQLLLVEEKLANRNVEVRTCWRINVRIEEDISVLFFPSINVRKCYVYYPLTHFIISDFYATDVDFSAGDVILMLKSMSARTFMASWELLLNMIIHICV
mgnify:CR=1 FL=1